MRLVHVSDLHFGAHDDALGRGLAQELCDREPDLVVASGDFTQIGSRDEFISAKAFLDELKVPFITVPGNHDVPAKNLVRRFFDPYGRYRKYIHDEIEPYMEVGGVAFAGLNTARRMRIGLNWSHGSISRGQLSRLEQRFDAGTPDALRVVVAHHPLIQPETPGAVEMRLVDRADIALATFARLGVRLVLSGHFHMSYVRRHTHAVLEGAPSGAREAAAAPILVAQASSAISTRLRGEANAYNVIDLGTKDEDIQIAVREWTGKDWRTRESAPVALPQD